MLVSMLLKVMMHYSNTEDKQLCLLGLLKGMLKLKCTIKPVAHLAQFPISNSGKHEKPQGLS